MAQALIGVTMTEARFDVQPRSPIQMETLEEWTSTYQRSLSDDMIDYLIEGRGLEFETIARFRLGQVAEPLVGHGHLRDWLSIPYLDKDGKPLKVRFRRPPWDEDSLKYLDLSGWGVRMFNVRALHEGVVSSEEIHVTEGEFDAMILEQIGLHAVAIPGAKSWRPYHRRMLAGFSRVHVWADVDTAGEGLADKITNAMRQARVVNLPYGDVSDVHLKEGPDGLLDLLN